MATWTAQVYLYNNNDANFRDWVKALHNALLACGMVQSLDTGQIDLATVTVPTTTNTYAGSEIWRFSDSLQATSPVFFRLDYGTGSTAGYPALRISVGTGSDGARNLTGVVFAGRQILREDSASSYYPWYASGDGGRLVVSMSHGSNYARGLLSLERGRNAAGTPVADDLRMLIGYRVSPFWYASYAKLSTGYAYGNIFPLASAPTSSTGSAGNAVALYPIRCPSPAETSPLMGVVAYFNTDITAGIPVVVQGWDGANHTYMPLGSNVVATSPTYGGTTVVAILWE